MLGLEPSCDFFCIWGFSFPLHLFFILHGLKRLPDHYVKSHKNLIKYSSLPFSFSGKQQTKGWEEFGMPACEPGGELVRRGSCVLVSVEAVSQSPGKSASAGTCTYSCSCMSAYGPSSLNQCSKCFWSTSAKEFLFQECCQGLQFPCTCNNFCDFLPLNLGIEVHFLLAWHYGDHVLLLLSVYNGKKTIPSVFFFR